MISLLRLTPADAPMLSKLGGATLLQSHGHSAPPEIMNAYVARSFSEAACCAELEAEANIFEAIFYNGEPAGYSKIILNCAHPAVPLQPVTKLERIYLLQEFYDRKLGRELLLQAIDCSGAGGDKGMWLDVWQENKRAISFYQKAGFEVVGKGAFRLSPTHANPVWVMLLRY